jgi:hypothetical protein
VGETAALAAREIRRTQIYFWNRRILAKLILQSCSELHDYFGKSDRKSTGGS